MPLESNNNGKRCKRIGIVCCEVFEDELLFVIKEHPEIGKIIIVNTESSKYFEDIIRSNFPYEKIKIARELFAPRYLKREEELEIIVYILPLFLHYSPRELKEEVLSACMELQKHSDYLLVYYGLCGNSLNNLEDMLRDNNVKLPFGILKDENEEIVDDCVCALLGSKANYIEILTKEPGTFFLTPGYASHWGLFSKKKIETIGENRLKEIGDQLGIENFDAAEMTKYLLREADYKQVVALEYVCSNCTAYKNKCQTISSEIDLNLSYRKGTIRLLDDTLEKAILGL
ncbi:MAG: hypothetical protein AMQ74_00266 [Candidatus Methanofastidiosum methylothiophilum]|uniref:DUF1638 domain-containing protein n=1 Tax=Candidatus Methanofastidiosum methylothiophilum TaxID=1705564 RepID=A0A150JAH1_9EURY|nr:MAG: hypothetical protein AMQ74_00266 [Candidatus Methanofastidiosum methylthiophilus]